MTETQLSVPAVFNSFHISPKQDEKNDTNFPKTIGAAYVLFHRVEKPERAEQLQQNMTALLEVLQQGPDGKSEVSIGKLLSVHVLRNVFLMLELYEQPGNGCICFECGHVGLPKNNDEACASRGNNPAPSSDFVFICKKCSSSTSVNLVMGVQPDGSTLPWIEKSSI